MSSQFQSTEPAAVELLASVHRIPTAGKIRAGIRVLTRAAAQHPQARALYEHGLAQGQTFDEIERAIAKAVPTLKAPLVPRNVPWFTVRPQDFSHASLAQEIVARFSEDRGEGAQVYRFPVIFPADDPHVVMPHELAVWSAHEKRYWSAFEGGQRLCRSKAPVPIHDNGKRVVRVFGARKTVLRQDNEGRCEPEVCPEYQLRQCNLTGRFIFFIPGIRSLSAFELPTRSFYAMSAALQMFEAVKSMRGGRLAGFIDRERTPFYFTKRLMQVSHLDEAGQLVRMPQWIVDLEAPVDVSELLAQRDDQIGLVAQADRAVEVLQGPQRSSSVDIPEPPCEATLSAESLLAQAQSMGISQSDWSVYTAQRWGPGWALNTKGRQRVADELDRYREDPPAYRRQIAARLLLTEAP